MYCKLDMSIYCISAAKTHCMLYLVKKTHISVGDLRHYTDLCTVAVFEETAPDFAGILHF